MAEASIDHHVCVSHLREELSRLTQINQDVVEGQMQQAPANPQDKAKEKKAKRFPSALPGLTPEKPATKAPEKPAAPALAAVPDAKPDPKPDKPSGGGEVVRLDRFRKK